MISRYFISLVAGL